MMSSRPEMCKEARLGSMDRTLSGRTTTIVPPRLSETTDDHRVRLGTQWITHDTLPFRACVHSCKRTFVVNKNTWVDQAVAPLSRTRVSSSLIDRFSLWGGDLAKNTIYSV